MVEGENSEEENFKLINKRLSLIEDEIERIQKDVQILGENAMIKIPCYSTFENSFTKKLVKENGESGEASQTSS